MSSVFNNSLHLQLVSVGLDLFEIYCIIDDWHRFDMISFYSTNSVVDDRR